MSVLLEKNNNDKNKKYSSGNLQESSTVFRWYNRYIATLKTLKELQMNILLQYSDGYNLKTELCAVKS